MDAQPLRFADSGVAAVATEPEAGVARCPVDHRALAALAALAPACPVDHGARPLPMGRADVLARRILRIRTQAGTSAAAYSAFRRSMFISATRCLLTYIVFPFVLPAVGFATGVGPWLGLAIGSVAIVCDVFAVRRFFAVGHRWRWHFAAVASGIIGLLGVLLVQDIVHLVT